MSVQGSGAGQQPARGANRRAVLLRLDPAVHDALQQWSADEFRSVNAQMELMLRESLRKNGRLPKHAGPLPRRGRPPKAG